MADKSAFDKDAITSINSESRNFLEELNLPPAVISFIRKNSKQLQIAAVALILATIAYSGVDYYLGNQRQQAASLLARAMKSDGLQAESQLQELVSSYSSSAAARWGQLELGNRAYNAGNFTAAVASYQQVLDDIGKNSPLTPLVYYGIAIAHEAAGDFDQSMHFYELLKDIKGFEPQGYLGLGRIYEAKQLPDLAKENYNKFLALENIPAASLTQIIKDKVAKL